MKRKLIDLDLETERRLSILASANGMSLKKYIQCILFQHGNEHIIKIDKEEKSKKAAVKNQLSILDEISKTEEAGTNAVLEKKIEKARSEKKAGTLKTVNPKDVWTTK